MHDREWLMDRIAATKALIIKYEEAIDAISTGAQSYSLDTGQTRQVVTKAQLPNLQLTLQRLEVRLDTLQQRLCGTPTIMRPNW
jgi:hypothetical protein